jgi:hypothetical protein
MAKETEFLKRIIFRKHANGINFLGYIIRPKYILVRRRVINNLKEKIRQFSQAKVKDLKKFYDSVSSYLGHLRWANSYRLTNKLTNFLKGGIYAGSNDCD